MVEIVSVWHGVRPGQAVDCWKGVFHIKRRVFRTGVLFPLRRDTGVYAVAGCRNNPPFRVIGSGFRL